jgi:hypothetical protein
LRECDTHEQFPSAKQIVNGHIVKVGQNVRLILTGHVCDIPADGDYDQFLSGKVFGNFNTKIVCNLDQCTVVSHDAYFLVLAVPPKAYPYRVADGLPVQLGRDPAPGQTGLLLGFDTTSNMPYVMSVLFAPSKTANGGVEEFVYTFDANESTIPGDCGAIVVSGNRVIGCHIASAAVQGGGRKGYAHPYSFASTVLTGK